jgi:hypothetical protein
MRTLMNRTYALVLLSSDRLFTLRPPRARWGADEGPIPYFPGDTKIAHVTTGAVTTITAPQMSRPR